MSDNGMTPSELRFQALLDHGMGREKAVRILSSEFAGGEPETFDDWSDEELFGRRCPQSAS